MNNPMDLSDRRIMVTGASAGIGRATAVLLSELGAHVVLVGRNLERLDETRRMLAGDGHVVEPFDLENVAEITTWFHGVVGRTGPFDGLAHCAGVQAFMPLRFVSVEELESTYRINTVSAVMLLKALTARGMCAPSSSVVFVSSIAAVIGVATNSVYGASKAALISLCRSLAMELVDKHVRINCVAPGLVETEMVQRAREMMPPELFEAMVEKHPLGIGQPVDVANAIAFLLADTGRWITGQTLILDGGLSVP